MKRYVASLLIILLSVSCKQIKSDTKVTVNSDGINLDIPLNKDSSNSYLYSMFSKDASLLHLDSLEQGYDSLQIRIWLSYAHLDDAQIFILKKDRSRWLAESVVTHVIVYNNKEISRLMLSDTITRVVYNKTNIKAFLSKLFTLKVMSLQGQDDIPGYKGLGEADGSICAVEVATKNSYRFYSFWEPGQYKGSYWQVNNMMQIIQLIEQEFGFKTLKPL